MRTKDYVAVKIGKSPQGRILWRLYLAGRSGRPALAVGDYSGHRGKSGLRKIYDQLSFRNIVQERVRVARDQFCFRVHITQR